MTENGDNGKDYGFPHRFENNAAARKDCVGIFILQSSLYRICLFYATRSREKVTSTKSYLFRSHSTVKTVISTLFFCYKFEKRGCCTVTFVVSLGKSAKPHIMTGSAYIYIYKERTL